MKDKLSVCNHGDADCFKMGCLAGIEAERPLRSFKREWKCICLAKKGLCKLKEIKVRTQPTDSLRNMNGSLA